MKAWSKVSSLLILAACAGLTIAGWYLLARPASAPDWQPAAGIAFSPYQRGQNNLDGEGPGTEEIEQDLALLSGYTRSLRTYSSSGVFATIPHLAADYGLDVSIGAWLDADIYTNEQELAGAIRQASLPNVSQVLIGNEVLLRKEMPAAALFTYLDQARARIEKPVSTAETWTTWLEYPQLAEHVDFIAVHILPYWEGIALEQAPGFIVDIMSRLQTRFPDKSILIAEAGWPSEGRTRFDAVASPANQSWFVRQFLALAEREQYDYFLMEAFDQPWKRQDEGAVGAYWGIFDVDRELKIDLSGPISKLPGWSLLGAVSVSVAILILGLIYLGSQTLTWRGKLLLALIVSGISSLICWSVADFITMYMTPAGIGAGLILLLVMLGLAILILSEAHEWIEAHWFSHRRRVFKAESLRSGKLPMVSIHVPAYNEPPLMLMQTLSALARLDYDNYEVIVVDNNTPNDAAWKPVEQHCQRLGPRFHFHHIAPLSGFKAGALNYALKHTDASASVIAVIDSDYLVEPDWLKALVPAFENPSTAIVQAPQDYRDGSNSLFKTLCDAEYQGFFQIGMVTRNERNAIIQHGTMTLVRRKALEEVGGWAQWCITEDAELGLRIFEAGYEALYTPQSYGRGLTPDTFTDYKKQRYRWAYGAMQILKRHWRQLFLPGTSQLKAGQRYHFVCGWLPWLAQGANLVFSILAILWSLGMLLAPESVETPHIAFSLLPLFFFSVNLAKLFHLYLFRLKVGPLQAFGAGIASLALVYTVGKAMLVGLFRSAQPFVRTPKQASPHAFSMATAGAFEEILLFFIYVLTIYLLSTTPHIASPDFTLWRILLLIQSLPFAAALVTTVLSTRLFSAPAKHSFESRSDGSFEIETGNQ